MPPKKSRAKLTKKANDDSDAGPDVSDSEVITTKTTHVASEPKTRRKVVTAPDPDDFAEDTE